MELEALQEVDPEVRARGARIVALTPELERYTRSVHKKLNLTFDILTDLHFKTAEQFRLVFVLPDLLARSLQVRRYYPGQVSRRIGIPIADAWPLRDR